MRRPTILTHQMVMLVRADDPELDDMREYCGTRGVRVHVTDMLPADARAHIVWVPAGYDGDPAAALVYGSPVDTAAVAAGMSRLAAAADAAGADLRALAGEAED